LLPEEGAPDASPNRPGVLVVDDDPLVLNLLDMALRLQGFDVYLATGGREAIRRYQEHSAFINVALVDVRMAGLDGPATVDELRRLNPNLPCCFMSGHTGEYSDGDLQARGASYFFDKPFRLDQVAEVLGRLARAAD
jgi:CheY-like chemotaxis protein